MPVDARHGRRVPAGTRLARVLARVLVSMRRHALAELARGRTPDFAAFQEAIAGAVGPLLAHEWVLGARTARGDLKARRVGRPATKGAGDGVGSLVGGFGRLGGGRGADSCGLGVGDEGAPLPGVAGAGRTIAGRSRGGVAADSRPVVVKAVAGGLPPPLTPEGIRTAWDVFRPEAASAARTLALELAGSITETTRRTVRESIAAGLEAGETSRDIARGLLPLFGPERALTIAQSEASRSMHAGEVAAYEASGVVGGLEWLASSDSCSRCAALNGKRVKIGEPFYVDPKGGPYAVVTHPPLHPRCVTGETPVVVADIVAATRVEYQGPVVRVDFGGFGRVTVTPNHMFLTGSGFARAADLVEGDDVLRTGARPMDAALPAVGHPDVNGNPPRAEDVFRAFAESAGVATRRVPVAPEYLHGDAAFAQGEIEVVGAECHLADGGESGGGEPAVHVPLIPGRRDDGSSLLGRGDLTAVFQGLLDATAGRVGAGRELAALLWGVSRVAEKLGLGRGAGLESQLSETAGYHRAADAERIRHLKDARPGLVETTKVVGVEFDTLRHPVPLYDFQTRGTMYAVCNGIISSNCFCSTKAVLR